MVSFSPHILKVVEALDTKEKREKLILQAVETWDMSELVQRVSADLAADFEGDNEGFAQFIHWQFLGDDHIDENIQAATLDPVT